MTVLFYDSKTDDQLPSAVTPSASDLLVLFQSGNNAQISYTALAQAFLAELLPSVTVSANTTLSRAAHNRRTLYCSSALTLTAPSAATLGAGFEVRILNKPSSGTVTLSGVTSTSGGTTIAPGATVTLLCDGATVWMPGSGTVSSATPGTPGTPTTTSQGTTSLGITWTVPGSGGTPTFYKVYLSSSGTGTAPGTGWTQVATPSTNNATITGLTSSTTEYFQIIASNATGDGPASATAALATAASLAAPNAVTGLTVTAATSTTLTLSWAESGGPPSTRTVNYKPAGSGSYAAVPGGTFGATGGTITGLTASTSYDLQVVETNTTGSGTATLLAQSTTVAAPGPVTSLAASSITLVGASFTWTNSAGATAWKVYTKTPAGGGTYALVTSFGTAPSATGCVINTLAAGQTYDVQVVASNAGGDSTATTYGPSLLTLPGAVTSLAAGSITATGLSLTWTNASSATVWTVEYSPAGANTWSTISGTASSTGMVISGLSTATYDFRVTTGNTSGTSTTNAVLSGVTLSGTSQINVGGQAPMLWIDASQTGNLYADAARTTAASSGGSVLGVADASSSGVNQSAASGTAPTLILNSQNSLPGLKFLVSGGQFLSGVAGSTLNTMLAKLKTGSWTALFVLKPTQTTVNNYAVLAAGFSTDIGNTYGNLNIVNSSTNVGGNAARFAVNRYTSNGGASVSTSEPAATGGLPPTYNHYNTLTKMVVRFDASTGTLYLLALQPGSTTQEPEYTATNSSVTGAQLALRNAWDTLMIGKAGAFIADFTLYELVLWPTVATSTERDTLLTNATSKWAS